eukprot:TRINITY_DN28095_c0_g1_i1.p1 TRINITY_DN28095_c0_g1~~TRINITY_DN28095_c0_g1_i1.p1  ORF type:complete len:214 (+),score=57.45 TRINITY_DN28095_c0_g1_i1:143-784(+)
MCIRDSRMGCASSDDKETTAKQPAHDRSDPEEPARELFVSAEEGPEGNRLTRRSTEPWTAPAVPPLDLQPAGPAMHMRGVRSVAFIGTVYEVLIECHGTQQAPEAPWAVAFSIRSSNIKQAKFSDGLKEFGLGPADIQRVEQRVALKSSMTGTYLVDGQDFGFSSEDGISSVVLQKLTGGWEPSSGSYTVAVVHEGSELHSKVYAIAEASRSR